jgi:hypothetical protein
MNERDWQTRVVDLAELRRWKVYHPWTSVNSASGFPDLTIVRGDELVFAELKSERGKATAAQQEWLNALSRVEYVQASVWRPADWPSVQVVLQ